jgi:hypothetical protein
VKPFIITGGTRTGDGTVPKTDLIAVVVSALQAKRIKLAAELPMGAILEKELETFRDKATTNRSETSWRDTICDDIVLGLAVAMWWGERGQGLIAEPALVRGRPEPSLEDEQRRLGFDTGGLPRGVFDHNELPSDVFG